MAIALGEAGDAWGALAVLGVNVVVLLVGGTLTLIVQRMLARHDRTGSAPAGSWERLRGAR